MISNESMNNVIHAAENLLLSLKSMAAVDENTLVQDQARIEGLHIDDRMADVTEVSKSALSDDIEKARTQVRDLVPKLKAKRNNLQDLKEALWDQGADSITDATLEQLKNIYAHIVKILED